MIIYDKTQLFLPLTHMLHPLPKELTQQVNLSNFLLLEPNEYISFYLHLILNILLGFLLNLLSPPQLFSIYILGFGAFENALEMAKKYLHYLDFQLTQNVLETAGHHNLLHPKFHIQSYIQVYQIQLILHLKLSQVFAWGHFYRTQLPEHALRELT